MLFVLDYRANTQARPFGTGTVYAGTAYKTSLAGDGTEWKAQSPVGDSKASGAEFMCGRRTEGYPSGTFSGPDYWRFDGTCNYCGSINPDQLFQAIEDGCEIGPTDKNYKVYLEGAKAPKVRGACKFYFQHLSETAQRKLSPS